jgi:hypothetical protein
LNFHDALIALCCREGHTFLFLWERKRKVWSKEKERNILFFSFWYNPLTPFNKGDFFFSFLKKRKSLEGGLQFIFSFDKDFDDVKWLTRIANESDIPF